MDCGGNVIILLHFMGPVIEKGAIEDGTNFNSSSTNQRGKKCYIEDGQNML